MIITLLRKPLEGTVAENALKHGCGAINIDATRVGSEQRTYSSWSNSEESSSCYSYANAKKVPTFAISVEGRYE